MSKIFQASTLTLEGKVCAQVGSFKLDTGSFQFPLQGVTAIFGRSGSGKSTFLKVLSGLEPGAEGSLRMGDQFWLEGQKSQPAPLRDVGFVFQEAALFPHMTVRDNLRFGLRRIPKNLARQNRGPAFDWDEIVHRTGLGGLLDQNVATLSGGERQRVAIARALLMQPTWLCMDEPLSALDWTAKAELLRLIEEVVSHYRIPVVYVTHSPVEVERLADRVLFMKNGRIERIESLKSALSRVDSPLFREQGALALLEGLPLPVEQGLTPVQIGSQRLWVTQAIVPDHPRANRIRVRVLARDVSLALVDPKQVSIMNHLTVTISEILPYSEHHHLIRCVLEDGQTLFAEVTHFSVDRLQLTIGKKVFALIKSVALSDSLPGARS